MEAKQIPHIDTAIDLLADGHADMVPVSAKWWFKNRRPEFSASLVLPRREPTRVLVGGDKPEYIPKNGVIIADCEIVMRQLKRSRNDISVTLDKDLKGIPDDVFDRVRWLEEKRQNDDIDGYVTTRSLYSSLGSRARRHTLGLQREDDTRFRFVPVPLEGYTCLLYTSPSPRDWMVSRMPSSA